MNLPEDSHKYNKVTILFLGYSDLFCFLFSFSLISSSASFFNQFKDMEPGHHKWYNRNLHQKQKFILLEIFLSFSLLIQNKSLSLQARQVKKKLISVE